MNKEKRKKKMRISNNDSDNEYQEETICEPTMVDMETCEKEDNSDNLNLENTSIIQYNPQPSQNSESSQLLLRDPAKINQTLNFDDTIIGGFNTQTEIKSNSNPNSA